MSEATALACPSCGEPTGLGDRFCEACGHELLTAGSGESAAEGTAPADASAVPEVPVVTLADQLPCAACGSPAQWLDGYCGVCGARQPAPRDHMELTLPGLAGVTDRGRRHHRNEDAFAAAVGSGFVAVVVCDGVSTTVKPDDASQAAADAALAVLLAGDGSAPHLDLAYDAARAAVLAVPFEPHPELGPPSCTFLAATLPGAPAPGAPGAPGPGLPPGGINLASSGDCRSYWVAADGSVSTLTVDDSWAQEELAAGRPPEEVWADRRAHSITRWLGADADPDWRPTISRFELPGPGRLLLCSDGLWNYTLEESHLAVLVKEAGDADLLDLARRLTRYANDAGGSDNITVVLVDVPGPQPTAGPASLPEAASAPAPSLPPATAAAPSPPPAAGGSPPGEPAPAPPPDRPPAPGATPEAS